MYLRGTCVLLLFVLCVLLERANSYQQPYEDLADDEKRAWNEFQEFREWKRSGSGRKRDAGKVERDSSSDEDSDEQRMQQRDAIVDNVDDSIGENIISVHHRRGSLKEQPNRSLEPPPIDQPALMGRYIVNQADWTSVATISSREDIASFPFVNIISMSDGPLGNGTGVPYMFLTPLDFTAKDLALDHRATLMMTLAQTSYCKNKVMDPMDPRCARIVMTGKIKEVLPYSSEYNVAKNAVFVRHPWLANMPANHHFFFAKLKIASIAVLDTFGGPKYVTVKDYFNPPTPKDRKTLRHRYNAEDENLNTRIEDRRYAYRF